ncbi:MAG TPA: AMP-binding protein, partial [Candidatus Xenobia bacterium]
MSQIEALLSEQRSFPPSEAFRDRALVSDKAIYNEDLETFWAREAENLEWMQKWDTVLDWKVPHARWFSGGRLNVAVNCVDRHARTWRRNKAAIMWEGEPGDERVLTYGMLEREVNRAASMLRGLGVKKGDRVTIYMGMVPELPVAMLACARIGAPHSVVFGGFSSESLRDRILDADSRIVLTQDGSWRRGNVVALKTNVDEALQSCPDVKTVVVVKRLSDVSTSMQAGRDHWWHELVDKSSPRADAEPMDAEDVLYLLYTSGTTGKPKGIVHTTAGYLLGTSTTHRLIFDLHEEDVYWCTADIGWVTGHSYILYGPLCNGATSVMYEGAPDWPDKDRFWKLV